MGTGCHAVSLKEHDVDLLVGGVVGLSEGGKV